VKPEATSAITSPFLKWAGGKRWLVSSHAQLLPKTFNRYYEPFLGGGAIFFSLRPADSTLSDLNQELIDCYIAIRDECDSVERLLADHHVKHCKQHYLEVRSSKPEGPVERAARMIYLNRTCWNALYRVNLKGEFNVPIGTKQNVLLPSDNFSDVSSALKNSIICHRDFETIVDEAHKGDFIFADPPYTVKHNFNGFVKYNEKIFQWSDQVRLSKCLIRASNRGCKILLTNANHQSIVDLYEGCFEFIPLERNSVIAASSSKRGKYEELIIRNYKD
jgi:DNA adenine methylase